MISADSDWQRARVNDLFRFDGQTFAGGVNFVEIFKLLVKAGQGMRAFNRQITAVVDFIAETGNSLCQSGNAHR